MILLFYTQFNTKMSAPNCNYCKTAGHSKYTCPVLSKKKIQKKSARDLKSQERRNANLVKKWGNTPEGMQRLWDDAQMKIDSFRDLEKEAFGFDPNSLEFDTLANELASLEKEYEAALSFQSYVEKSDITFSPMERNVRHGTRNFYTAIQQQSAGLADISSKLEEMLDDEMTAAGVSVEDTLIQATDHYWSTQYGKGRTVFYGWLDATTEARQSLKGILAGNSWKTEKPTDVLDLSTIGASKKTKIAMPRTRTKKSQKQKRLEAMKV